MKADVKENGQGGMNPGTSGRFKGPVHLKEIVQNWHTIKCKAL